HDGEDVVAPAGFERLGVEPAAQVAAVARAHADDVAADALRAADAHPDRAACLGVAPDVQVDRALPDRFGAGNTEHPLERRIDVHDAAVAGVEDGDDARRKSKGVGRPHVRLAPPRVTAGRIALQYSARASHAVSLDVGASGRARTGPPFRN